MSLRRTTSLLALGVFSLSVSCSRPRHLQPVSPDEAAELAMLGACVVEERKPLADFCARELDRYYGITVMSSGRDRQDEEARR